MTNPEDELFRAVFSLPRHADPLLRMAMPDDLARSIDWGSLAPAPAAVLAGRAPTPHSELLFTAGLQPTGGRVWLLLLRISDASRDAMADVMDAIAHVRDRVQALEPDREVPPAIVPIVLHHGGQPLGGAVPGRDGPRPRGLPSPLRVGFGRPGDAGDGA